MPQVAGPCWWVWKARSNTNMAMIPVKTAAQVREAEPSKLTACGNICSMAIPSIKPPTKLISSWVRKCVIRIKEGNEPPSTEPTTITAQ